MGNEEITIFLTSLGFTKKIQLFIGLNLVAMLIANGNLDIKIAFLQNEDGFRLYHEKIAVFTDVEQYTLPAYCYRVNKEASSNSSSIENE